MKPDFRHSSLVIRHSIIFLPVSPSPRLPLFDKTDWGFIQKVFHMKAAYINQTGPPENIVIGQLPTPEPTGTQMLVRVRAAALNPVDTYIRAGTIPMNVPLPYIVGCDLAGVVEELGLEASRFRVGDRVWGTNQGLLGRQGTFAEYAAVDECWLYATPKNVSDETAAACALVSITAHLGLVRDAKLQAGETLFVNGGTGGVGSMVVQMAKALGARVITTAGSNEKVAACRELGADAAINYKTEDVPARVKQFAPDGVNVWWETLREPNFDVAVPLLAPRGRMILMAGRDARPPFPVGPFYVKGCHLYGFAMFNATAAEQQVAANDINRWLAAGKIKPRIDRVLPLDQTAAAHRLQEENTIGKAGTLAGKIVIKP
jgi:NADPH2:quinone reductase